MSFSDVPVTMESSVFSSPFALLLITLVSIGVIKVIAKMHYLHTYWKKRGVPYIRAMPALGITWKMLSRRMNFSEYIRFNYEYAPDAKYIGLMDMATPLIFIRDPELIRDVMVKDFEHFTDHQTFSNEDIDPLFGKNVFALRGNRWKEMRNTLSPSFTASKMKVMFELVSKCSREFSDYLADHPEECSSVDTKEIFRRYTTDVIATSAFGINVNSMKDRDNEFFTRGVDTTQLFNGFSFMLKFMLFRASPRLMKALGINFFPPATSQFFKKIVAETIKTREEQGIIRPDMIHLLMQARNKEGLSVHDMTLDDIVSQAFIFFLAGFDTSSQLMCFIAHELAVNRDIQDRLYEEVEKHFAEGNGEISYELVSKMVYMDMVVSETLRKYPPVVMIDRLCVKSYELPPPNPGGKSVIVEPNHVIWAPVYALHCDPKYFPNPDKFDPERFSDENKDNIVPYTYMPFGHGPRKCIGNRFALMETKLLIAHLLHKFVFKATEKTIYPVVFDKKQFNLQPEGGFWIAFEKREK